MSSVLDRDALEQSPLADLHLIANELGVDGFRRLRKPDLIDAIIARQSGTEAPTAEEEAEAPRSRRRSPAKAVADADEEEAEAQAAPARRRARAKAVADADADADAEVEVEAESEDGATDEDAPARTRRGRRGGRGRGRREGVEEAPRERETAEERTVEGVVELLGNGSAFIRLGEEAEATDDDVYVSAAQVKRCELVSGDRIAGPVRAPRRSERFPSLVRVDTINGRPAEEVAEGTKFEDLPSTWPTERLALGSEDVTLKAVEWLTPFGKGSRVLICGGPRAGKTELARDIVEALSGRGGDAVVVIDTLEYVQPHAARRALAAARNIVDGGSLTVIATAPAPFGGESTVVALDAQLTALRRFPALDLPGSGTVRADTLVGDAGAEAIAKARAEAAAATE